MKHIMKCTVCGSYTMKAMHCNANTINAKPPKWSPEDKYGEYRRKIKKEELIKRGML